MDSFGIGVGPGLSGATLALGTDPAERRRRAQERAERNALNLLPDLVRPVEESREIARLPRRNTDTPEFPEPYIPQDPERRSFRRNPTGLEVMERLTEVPREDAETRAALVRLATGLRGLLPREAEVPQDVKDALEAATIGQALVLGRQLTPEQAEPVARAAAQLGTRPSLDQMLLRRPTPLTPAQRETERRAQASEDFRQRLQAGEVKLDTDADWQGAIEEATSLGATDVASGLMRQWRSRKMTADEARRTQARETIAPSLRAEVDRLGQHRHFTAEDRQALESAIARLEETGDPKIEAEVRRALVGMPKQLAERAHRAKAFDQRTEQFTARMKRVDDRIEMAKDRVSKGDARGAASALGQAIVQLRAEQRGVARDLETDPNNPALRARHDALQDAIEQYEAYRSDLISTMAPEGVGEVPRRESGGGAMSDLDQAILGDVNRFTKGGKK